MALGSGIALIVIGAVLSFALDLQVEGVDFVLIGYICMGAGLVAVILSLIVNAQRANTSHRQVTEQVPAQPVQQVPVQPVQQVPPQQVQQVYPDDPRA